MSIPVIIYDVIIVQTYETVIELYDLAQAINSIFNYIESLR